LTFEFGAEERPNKSFNGLGIDKATIFRGLYVPVMYTR